MSAPRSSSWLQRSLGFLLVSAAMVAGCGGQDTRPDTTFAFIGPAIIEPNCATVSCHSAVAQRAGVVLEPSATAYKTLTTRHFVISMDPDESEIMALITAQGVRRMPPDFPLPAADIDLIRRWIANGANP
jgi:hypothetical protein